MVLVLIRNYIVLSLQVVGGAAIFLVALFLMWPIPEGLPHGYNFLDYLDFSILPLICVHYHHASLKRYFLSHCRPTECISSIFVLCLLSGIRLGHVLLWSHSSCNTYSLFWLFAVKELRIKWRLLMKCLRILRVQIISKLSESDSFKDFWNIDQSKVQIWYSLVARSECAVWLDHLPYTSSKLDIKGNS